MSPSTSQDVPPPEPQKRGGSRLIGRMLPVAVKLWLNTQLEQLEALSFELEGSDRQILSGYVPQVSISADQAVYRGIHVNQVQLKAQEVRFNLGQVLRGKPLRLLQDFGVEGQIQLTETDLNTSLNAEYLAEGVGNFWRTLFAMAEVAQELVSFYELSDPATLMAVDWRQCQSSAQIKPGHLTLQMCQGELDQTLSVILQAQLQIRDNRYLVLCQPHWLKTASAMEGDDRAAPSEALSDFQWDLGEEACLRTLTLSTGHLVCEGQVTVKP